MAIVNLRLNPFTNVLSAKAITNEEHTIPETSPYTIRLIEVPRKDSPSTLVVKFKGGSTLSEVAANPSSGQFWADYNTNPTGYDNWNTGTLLFSSADAGKTVQVTYNGIGTLVDDRINTQMSISVTGSTQPQRNIFEVDGFDGNVYDSKTTTGSAGDIRQTKITFYSNPGISDKICTLQALLQELVDKSHTHTISRETIFKNCTPNCGD